MIEIKWNDLIMVAGAAIGVSALVVTLFSLGVRLLTNAQHAVSGKGKNKGESVSKEIAFRFTAVVAFALASSVMAYGLYILVTFSKLQAK
jgi:hypothetical protein